MAFSFKITKKLSKDQKPLVQDQMHQIVEVEEEDSKVPIPNRTNQLNQSEQAEAGVEENLLTNPTSQRIRVALIAVKLDILQETALRQKKKVAMNKNRPHLREKKDQEVQLPNHAINAINQAILPKIVLKIFRMRAITVINLVILPEIAQRSKQEIQNQLENQENRESLESLESQENQEILVRRMKKKKKKRKLSLENL